MCMLVFNVPPIAKVIDGAMAQSLIWQTGEAMDLTSDPLFTSLNGESNIVLFLIWDLDECPPKYRVHSQWNSKFVNTFESEKFNH